MRMAPPSCITRRTSAGATPRAGAPIKQIRARAVIGADGAKSAVARQCIPGAERMRFVAAYHEIVRAPTAANDKYVGTRCDVYYQGACRPISTPGYFRMATLPASESGAQTKDSRCALP